MNFLIRSPSTLVWLVLVAATCLTALLAETERSVRWAVIATMLIASIKVWMIMQHFMELKTAPTALRTTWGVWLLVVTAVVLAKADFLRSFESILK